MSKTVSALPSRGLLTPSPSVGFTHGYSQGSPYGERTQELKNLNHLHQVRRIETSRLIAADTGAAAKFEAEVEEQMGNPLVRGDAKLMLRCLVTKAAIDQEKNEASARDIWEKILDVAKGLGDQQWEAQAQAQLGIITFMDGDVEKASGMLKTALLSAYLLGDLGAAIYYGSIVGNGLVEVGQPETGLGYCETALKTTAATKDVGFPFIAYEGIQADLSKQAARSAARTDVAQ